MRGSFPQVLKGQLLGRTDLRDEFVDQGSE